MDATKNFVLDGSVTMVWGFEKTKPTNTPKRSWNGCLIYRHMSRMSLRQR